jgi:hypothetical protein
MLTYRVKVRNVTTGDYGGVTFIWGGAGVNEEIKSSLYLHFRVDDVGEKITFGILQKVGVSKQAIDKGTLSPGECFSIRLDAIFGVYARIPSPQDTYVDCAIISAH